MTECNGEINGNVFQTFSKNAQPIQDPQDEIIVNAFSFKKGITDNPNEIDDGNSCYYYSGKFPEEALGAGICICDKNEAQNSNNNNITKQDNVNPFQYQICTYSTCTDETKSFVNMINDCSFLTECTPKYKPKHKKGMSICEYFGNSNNTNCSNKSTSFSNLCKGISLLSSKKAMKFKGNDMKSGLYVKQRKRKELKSTEDIEMERIKKEKEAIKVFQKKHQLQYEKYYNLPVQAKVYNNTCFLNKKRMNTNHNDISLLTKKMNDISIKGGGKNCDMECKENCSLLSNASKQKNQFNSLRNSTKSFKSAFSKPQGIQNMKPALWNPSIKKQNVVSFDNIMSQYQKSKKNIS